jgi:hypothetical protein
VKKIRISNPELIQASYAGCMRVVTSIKRSAKGRYGATEGMDGRWQSDIIGCIGELVVAKMLDKFWSGAIGTYHPGDVGAYEVRATSKPSNTSLLLHPPDGDDKLFFLVIPTPDPQVFDVHGPILARHGKLKEYWQTLRGRSAFFVPRELVEQHGAGLLSDIRGAA